MSVGASVRMAAEQVTSEVEVFSQPLITKDFLEHLQCRWMAADSLDLFAVISKSLQALLWCSQVYVERETDR